MIQTFSADDIAHILGCLEGRRGMWIALYGEASHQRVLKKVKAAFDQFHEIRQRASDEKRDLRKLRTAAYLEVKEKA